MNSYLRRTCRIALLLATSAAAHAGIWEKVMPRDLRTVAVTDLSEEGRRQRRPTREQPVYFVAVSAGYRDMGAAAAGEKRMNRPDADKTILSVLAKEGYLPADNDHQPELLVAWRWGTMNVERIGVAAAAPSETGPDFSAAKAHWESTQDKSQRDAPPMQEPAAPPLWSGNVNRSYNERQMLRFLGGEKAGVLEPAYRDGPYLGGFAHFEKRMGAAQELTDLAQEDLYVAIVTAYAPTLHEGKLVPLWTTRISCPARGFWLPDALPVMLTMAAPYLGRETDRPVVMRAADTFTPNVDIGDVKVIEYIEPMAVAEK